MVALTLVASGAVADITAADRVTFVATAASLADTPPAAVTLSLEAASLMLTFRICIAGSAAAAATEARLGELMPNASQASAWMNLSAEIAPVISTLDGAGASLCSLQADGSYHAVQPPPPPPLPPPPSPPPPSPAPPSPPLERTLDEPERFVGEARGGPEKWTDELGLNPLILFPLVAGGCVCLCVLMAVRRRRRLVKSEVTRAPR